MLTGAGVQLFEGLPPRHGQGSPLGGGSPGEEPVEGLAPLDEVLVFGRIHRRPVVGRVFPAQQSLVGDLVAEVKPVAQLHQLLVAELLDLVGGVAALDVGSERPALDGLGEDDGGGAFELGGRLVGGVDLVGVEAAAP